MCSWFKFSIFLKNLNLCRYFLQIFLVLFRDDTLEFIESFALFLLYFPINPNLLCVPSTSNVCQNCSWPLQWFCWQKPSHRGLLETFFHWYLCNHRYKVVSSMKMLWKVRTKKKFPYEHISSWVVWYRFVSYTPASSWFLFLLLLFSCRILNFLSFCALNVHIINTWRGLCCLGCIFEANSLD